MDFESDAAAAMAGLAEGSSAVVRLSRAAGASSGLGQEGETLARIAAQHAKAAGAALVMARDHVLTAQAVLERAHRKRADPAPITAH